MLNMYLALFLVSLLPLFSFVAYAVACRPCGCRGRARCHRRSVACTGRASVAVGPGPACRRVSGAVCAALPPASMALPAAKLHIFVFMANKSRHFRSHLPVWPRPFGLAVRAVRRCRPGRFAPRSVGWAAAAGGPGAPGWKRKWGQR